LLSEHEKVWPENKREKNLTETRNSEIKYRNEVTKEEAKRRIKAERIRRLTKKERYNGKIKKN
jgi:hypothetical protein